MNGTTTNPFPTFKENTMDDEETSNNCIPKLKRKLSTIDETP